MKILKSAFCLVVFLPLLMGVTLKQAPTAIYPVPLDAELQAHIISVSDAYNVDPVLVMAIIEKESTFDATRIGDNGNSYGLMQVNVPSHPDRMAKLGVTNLLCPYCNVLIGIDYFAELLERYGDTHMALIGYNAGPSKAYEGWFSVGRYQSDYSRAVVARAEEIGGFEIE